MSSNAQPRAMNASRDTLPRIDTSATSATMEHAPSFSSLQEPGKGARVGPEMMSPVHGDMDPRSVVLFSETGVGKSSLINLIAGEHLAQTSNDAFGCTAQHQRYDVTLPCNTSGSGSKSVSVTVSLWDTAGLDEGTQGTVPATTSITHLKSHLQNLASSPTGIRLLLFCVRGTVRLTRALQRHYDLIYAGVCRKKVRIALVVTGLEHQYLERPAGMESWLEENEGVVMRLGTASDEHACVTTADAEEGTGRERRLASQRQLRELVVRFTQPGTTPWKIERSWCQSMVVPILGSLLRAWRHVEVDASRVHKFYMGLKQWLVAAVVSEHDGPVDGDTARPALTLIQRRDSLREAIPR